jgi:hypothetical protein
MPVDRWNMHSTQRDPFPIFAEFRKRQALEQSVMRRGALRLSTVPRERTTADAVRLALEAATRSGLTNPDELVPADARYKTLAAALEDFLQQNGTANQKLRGEESDSVVALGTSMDRSRSDAVSPRALRIWDLLERTTMDAPAHGVLVLRGKALVETTLLECLYNIYPRMRSKHAQVLVHQSCGLLSVSRIASRLGLVDMFGVHTEAGLWRELNTLQERMRTARRMATIHKERMEEGLGAQRRWYWRSVLKSAARKVAKFPVTPDQIQPRLEWLRHQVFQWIACVDELEGSVIARTLILRLFCSQLGRKWHAVQLERQARRALGSGAPSSSLNAMPTEGKAARESLAAALAQVDGEAVGMPFRDALDENDTSHPMVDFGRRKHDSRNSSYGDHATQPLVDDLRESRWESAKSLAPPMVVDLVNPPHAFREIQLVLKYDPFVADTLRGAPVDVDVSIQESVEVHETNSLAVTLDRQQFRQVQYKEVKLYAGRHCIGIGKGETEMIATQEASIHALLNYYLRQGPFVVDEDADARPAGPPVDPVSSQSPPGALDAENRSEAPEDPSVSDNRRSCHQARPDIDLMDVIMGADGGSEEALVKGKVDDASQPEAADDSVSSYFF